MPFFFLTSISSQLLEDLPHRRISVEAYDDAALVARRARSPSPGTIL